MHYPIRQLGEIWRGKHESAHCTAVLELFGVGFVERATIDGMWHGWPRVGVSDADRLTIIAAGIAGAKHFGAGDHHGGAADIRNAAAISLRLGVRGPIEWKAALERAADIVERRSGLVDELGTTLERVREMTGAEIDALWKEFYPHATPTAIRSAPALSDEPVRVFDDARSSRPCVGSYRRRGDDWWIARSTDGIRQFHASSAEAARRALLRDARERDPYWD
jgi:hypothetical protein